MKKELLAEVEGCYVRSCCSIPKYGIVTLQIYRIDSQEIRFENHCPPERLPERFAEGVEEGVYYFASEHGIQGIQVELLDGGWFAQKGFHVCCDARIVQGVSAEKRSAGRKVNLDKEV